MSLKSIQYGVNYDKSIAINPTDWITWNNRGYALIALGSYEEALFSLEKASELEPGQSISWERRGEVLFELGRYKEAQNACDRAIKIDPNQSSTYFWKGIILHRQKFFSEALVSYNSALQLNEQNWSAWVQRGWTILRIRGFESALEALDEVLHKLPSNSSRYLEVRGNIYFCKGSACYQERYNRGNSWNLWTKAARFYQVALESFEQLEFQENHLETLQGLVKVFLSLEQIEEADEFLRRGTDYLQRLLDETPSPGKRKLLALKFAGFNQLSVDRYVQAGQLKEAWETAEKGKNACLSWLLYALRDSQLNHVPIIFLLLREFHCIAGILLLRESLYEQMQQLLTPGTAIAYWHLSPVALTTFVLKSGEPAPILITAPASTTERPESLQRLLKLEAWMEEWDDQYRDYRNKGKQQRNANHSWRKDMEQRLFERQEKPGNLKEILNIEAIKQHLNGINHLILIPHRDLHRFPIHALFDSQLVITYLPSAKVGLKLRGRKPASTSQLLSIENPKSDYAPDMRLALLESRMISQYFQNVHSLREADATQEQVINALSKNHTILHFSGHGTHHPENPKKSELLLAGTKSLTLEEICQQDLTTYDLVSLSACETALTNNQSITTEYVGLVSGFLSRGTAQVISTMWVVKSVISAVVMIEFYRRRQPHKPDAVILSEVIWWLRNLNQATFEQWCHDCLEDLSKLPRERQSEVKRLFYPHIRYRWGSIEEEIRHPYAWAAFTLSGGFF